MESNIIVLPHSRFNFEQQIATMNSTNPIKEKLDNLCKKNAIIDRFNRYEEIWMNNLIECEKDFRLRYLILSENVPDNSHYVYGEPKKKAEEEGIKEEDFSARDQKWRKLFRDTGILIFDLIPFHTHVKNFIDYYSEVVTFLIPYMKHKLDFIRKQFVQDIKTAKIILFYPESFGQVKKALKAPNDYDGVFGDLNISEPFPSNIPQLRGRITRYMNKHQVQEYHTFHKNLFGR